MKKIAFIVGLFMLFFTAQAQSKPVPLNNVVNSLEQKFSVSISYDSDLNVLFSQDEINEILSQSTISDALTKLTSVKKTLTFKRLRNDYYVISAKSSDGTVNTNHTGKRLSRKITGLVKDETGSPIPGATVVETGTNNATITDLNGKFELTVSDEAKEITVSFIGYQDTTITLSPDKDYYEITLQPKTQNIGAVVVSGVAGETPVKKLTVTVNHLDADQLDQAPAGSASSVLMGKIPGLVVTQASGQPGTGAAIRMRGVTSMLGNNSPLIIVDGIMVQTSLADINADDIESIEVVKGAAASALYGSKAAGGVIVITTKRGKNIKENYEVTIRNEYGTTQLGKYIKLAIHHPYVLDSNYQNYSYTRYAGVDYDDEGNVISGSRILTDSAYCDQPYAIIRNHQKDFFKNGNYYTNYVGLASRAKSTNFYLSFENHHNEGIIFHTKGYTRRNFRFNADTKIGKYIKLSTSNLYISSLSDKPGSNNSFYDLLFINPDVDLTAKNDDGSPYKILPDPWSIEENPLYPLYYRQRQTTKTTFMTNLKGSVYLTKWLTVESKYSYEKLNIYYNTYTPKGYLYNGGADIGGSIFNEYYFSKYQVYQTTANIKHKFGDFLVKSKLSYMYEDKYYKDFAVTGRDFIVPGIPQLTNTDPTQASMSSYDGTIRAIDVFGIVDMDYKSKYLFSGLYRRDGSSLFGANVRWRNYYRISGAYRITEDVKIPGFQELKLRAAYGTAGLRPGFSWQYTTFYFSNGYLYRDQIGNPDLKPAETHELEIALDADFLNRFSLTASYSISEVIGAFAKAPLASHLGYPYQWRNVGNIHSNTVEVSLNSKIFETKKGSWYLTINFDKIHQVMDSLAIPPFYTGPHSAYYVAPGEVFGVLYGYDWVRTLDQMKNQLPEGRTIDDYTVNSDGYVILKGTEGSLSEAPIPLDTDNDSIPDKVLIGDGNPDFHMSFANNLTIGGFTFYALIDWKQGGDIYNYTHQYTFRDARAIEFDQYGKPEDQKKSLYYYQTFYNQSINSYFVEDGTYVKIRELSVYYTFKPKWTNFVKSVRFGIVGRNVYTFTKYSGYDPEVASSGDLTTFAFDNFGYPNFRTITASLQLKF